MGEPPTGSATPTSTAPRLVLASGSPRRAELLARLGVTPLVRPADVDETPLDDESAEQMVSRLAASKALASAQAGDGHEIVLAADTIVVLEGRMLGKPRDRDDARQMLAALSGRTHRVITGVAVHRDAQRYTDRVTTELTFRELTDSDIDWYLATGECDDKAGAYGLQGAGAVLVERVDGSDTNVIGLPLAQTVALLRRAGLDLLGGVTAPGTD